MKREREREGVGESDSVYKYMHKERERETIDFVVYIVLSRKKMWYVTIAIEIFTIIKKKKKTYSIIEEWMMKKVNIKRDGVTVTMEGRSSFFPLLHILFYREKISFSKHLKNEEGGRNAKVR